MNELEWIEAFLCQGDSYIPTVPSDWDRVAAAIEALQARLRKDYDDGLGRDQWRKLASLELPSGVFVWRDEFERAFHKAHAPYDSEPFGDREDDGELNYTPLLSNEMRMKVLAGFSSIDGHATNRALVSGDLESAPGGDKGQENSVTWQEQARAIADELNMRDDRAGAHSSLTDMGDRVAVEMRERGVGGPYGPVAGATVKREALQGGLWTRTRGKKQAGEMGGMGEAKKTA